MRQQRKGAFNSTPVLIHKWVNSMSTRQKATRDGQRLAYMLHCQFVGMDEVILLTDNAELRHPFHRDDLKKSFREEL